MKPGLCLFALFVALHVSRAETLSVDAAFGNHMVLQRWTADSPADAVVLSGSCEVGRFVKIQFGNSAPVEAVMKGTNWLVRLRDLPKPTALRNDAFAMTLQSFEKRLFGSGPLKETRQIHDVVFGDVYVIVNDPDALRVSSLPKYSAETRFFFDDVPGQWVSGPAVQRERLSGTAAHLAIELAKASPVPVGIVAVPFDRVMGEGKQELAAGSLEAMAALNAARLARAEWHDAAESWTAAARQSKYAGVPHPSPMPLLQEPPKRAATSVWRWMDLRVRAVLW
jgi:hypothetical protein